MIRGISIGSLFMFLLFFAAYFGATYFTPQPWKRFYTSYVSFALPPQWRCEREATEWVCQTLEPGKRKHSIMILTAKIAGPEDTLENYETHLSKERDILDPNGNEIIDTSKIRLLERRNTRNIDWVVGVHIGSEIPSYETQYFTTVTKAIAIAITFSFHEDFRKEYDPIANQVTESIQLVL